MPLPFDMEDVVGVAMADLVRRFLALWSCLVTGTLAAGSALLMSGLAEEAWDWMHGRGFSSLAPPEPAELVLAVCFGFFGGLLTSFGVFYGAFLIGLAIYFFKAEMPHPYVWAGGAGVVALSVTGAAWELNDWWWSAVAMVFCLVLIFGLFFFAKWRVMILRVRAEQHFMGVAAENELRRQELREQTGGAVADREFALGDQGEEGTR